MYGHSHCEYTYIVDYARHDIQLTKSGTGGGGGHLLQMQPLSCGLFWLISDSSSPSGAQAAFRKPPECQTSGPSRLALHTYRADIG